jgi:hypothetical protein
MFTENIVFTPFTNTCVQFEGESTRQVEQEPEFRAFGILQLDINKFPNTKRMIDLEFYIDESASMNDFCSDGKKKMEHVLFASANIIRSINDVGAEATITVNAFDDTIREVVSKTHICGENIKDVIHKLDEIYPKGGTNLEAVFTCASKSSKTKARNGDKRFVFIFTDGEATSGETDNNILKNISDTIQDTSVIMIGCGLDHDYNLFTLVSEKNNNIYKFIGKIEEARLACNEILDKILNPVLENVSIHVENGEIYNWKQNTWSSFVCTENIIAECNKTYHVRSRTISDFTAIISGIVSETDEGYELIVVDRILNADLRKNKFRQRTLELLAEVNAYNHLKKQVDKDSLGIKLKMNMKNILVEMKAFMDENELREDKFMKMLCDDIVVCHSTFGSRFSSMYTKSRQTSQGSQGTHHNTYSTCSTYDMYNNTQSYDDSTTPYDSYDSYNPYDGFMSNLTIPKLSMTKLSMTKLSMTKLSMTKGLTQHIQSFDLDDDEEEESEYKGGAINASCGIFGSTEGLPPGLMFCSYSGDCHSAKSAYSTKNNNIVLLDEAEDIFQTHRVMDCDDSPYANKKTIKLMRYISVDKDQNENENVNDTQEV